VSAEVSLGGFTLRPVRPYPNRTPILPRRVRDPRRGRRRYVRRGLSGPGVNGSRNVTVVEDLECRDRPEDFLLDDRCAEVLDFDPVGRQKAPEASDPSVTGPPRTIAWRGLRVPRQADRGDPDRLGDAAEVLALAPPRQYGQNRLRGGYLHPGLEPSTRSRA
jgi:hypothetical protein